MDSIPTRESILPVGALPGQLARKQPVRFMPISVYDKQALPNFIPGSYGKYTYKILLFGYFDNGRKGVLIINDIQPFFEILVPKRFTTLTGVEYQDFTPQEFGEMVLEFLRSTKHGVEVSHFEVHHGLPLKYYQRHENAYVRVFFNKTRFRKKAITACVEHGLTVAYDQTNIAYADVVSRDHQVCFANWLEVSSYATIDNPVYFKSTDVVLLTTIGALKNIPSDEILSTPQLIRDSCMVMAWDFETYDDLGRGDVPKHHDADCRIFMVGISFQWHHAAEPFLRVCICDAPELNGKTVDGSIVVGVRDEREILDKFMEVIGRLRPDIMCGFNDGGYDWPWLLHRIRHHGLQREFMGNISSMKFDKFPNYAKDSLQSGVLPHDAMIQDIKMDKVIKIAGDGALPKSYVNVDAPGIIPVDVMIMMLMIFPKTTKYSLDHFLSLHKLGSKFKLSIPEMNAHYRAYIRARITGEMTDQVLDGYSQIIRYCVIDTTSCHKLMCARTIVSDRRDAAGIGFFNLRSSFYRPVGYRVENLAFSACYENGIRYSCNPFNTDRTNDKYAGAYVFPPVTGSVTSKPSIPELCKSKFYREEWAKVSPGDLAKCYEFIEQHGVDPLYLPPEIKKTEQYSQLPECMKKFLDMDTCLLYTSDAADDM
jgi:DNA polymerase elongation subunit (family B)